MTTVPTHQTRPDAFRSHRTTRSIARTRTRWAALGAALAVTFGGGGLQLTHAGFLNNHEPASYRSLQPCRLHDTRAATQVGDFSTPIGEDETRVLSGRGLVGECVIPKTATSIAVNAIGIGATEPTFLTMHPGTGGDDPPNASNLNVFPDQPPTPNFGIVPLDPGGEFALYNRFGNVDVVIDVVGYTEQSPLEDRFQHVVRHGVAAAGFIGDDPSDVVSLELDTDGRTGDIILHSSINVIDASAGDSIRCSIGLLDTEHATGHLQEWVSPGSPAGRGHLAGTRVVEVGDDFTADEFHLVCDHQGASGPGAFNDAVLTAQFVPNTPAALIVVG